MLEQVLHYERDVFLWLNGSDYTILDYFMWLISNKFVWFPLIVTFLYVLFYKKNWKEAVLVILIMAILITICDQVASGLLKPMFQRFRPTHHPDFMNEVKILFDYRGGRYGFASSHASNAFGVAMFTALLFRNKLFSLSIFTFALLNAYSRIYLGVHFISDIVAGALIGIIAGILCYQLYCIARKYILKIPDSELKKPLYSTNDVYLVSGVFWGTLLILLVGNSQLIPFFVR